MGLLQKIYDGFFFWTLPLQSVVLLAVRVFWGWNFANIGWEKIQNLPKTVDLFSKIGIIYPDFMAQTVGWIECVGGVMLLLGLLSRLASLPLVCVMIGAYATAHGADLQSISAFTQSPPFLFLYASLLVLCFGPGKLSIDALLRTK